MAAPLSRFKSGGQDISDVYVDTDTVIDSLDDTIPTSILTPEGVEALLARSLWVWGAGASGGLGLNTTFNRSSPTQIGTDTDWKEIDRNGNAAIKNNGSLWIWGAAATGFLVLMTQYIDQVPLKLDLY